MDRTRKAEGSVSPLSYQDPSVALDFAVTPADRMSIDAPLRAGSGGAVDALLPSPQDDPASPLLGVGDALRAIPVVRAGWWYGPAKRSLDLAVCLAILPFVAPVAGLVAIAIRLDSRGPVIFRQTRIGRDGRPFQILKFRTLRADHDPHADRSFMEAFVRGHAGDLSDGVEHVVNKPIQPSTVTRVGRFLRKSSLDELPQIFNVLGGEMSLVGPRPNVPWEVDAYLDWHRERLEATPGITGLAQVRGRSCVTFDTIAAADIEYVRRRSLALDIEILWRTVVCLVSGDGAG